MEVWVQTERPCLHLESHLQPDLLPALPSCCCFSLATTAQLSGFQHDGVQRTRGAKEEAEGDVVIIRLALRHGEVSALWGGAPALSPSLSSLAHSLCGFGQLTAPFRDRLSSLPSLRGTYSSDILESVPASKTRLISNY